MSCPQRCREDLCPSEARRNGLCWAHAKRRKLGTSNAKEIRPWGRTPKALLIDAALHYLEVDETDEQGWELAWHRLRMAARRYTEAEKRTKLAAGYRAKARGRGDGGRFAPR